MDGRQFDHLTKTLSAAPTRRDLLRVLSALPLAGSLTIVGGDETTARGDTRRTARLRSEGCIPTGRKCPSKRRRGGKTRRLSCARCCQRFAVTEPDGRRVCGCKPDGSACTEVRQCCSGVCTGNVCQAAP